MDDIIDPAQFGFRKGNNVTAYTRIQKIQEIHEEAGFELVTVLLDWGKAFDKIHQGRLLDALKRIGIPLKMVRAIEATHRNPKFSVQEMGKISSERRQNSGIRQGCPLSPYVLVHNSYDCNHERHKY